MEYKKATPCSNGLIQLFLRAVLQASVALYGGDVLDGAFCCIIQKRPRRELFKNTDLSAWSLQTHHVFFTLKRRGNGRFHVVSTWNTQCVFVGRA